MSSVQQQFFTTYSPYATQAGQALGVSPNTILAQWALESNYGQSSAAQNYNLAGISPGGSLASYSSPQDFTTSYVNTIQNNFPNAMNTGSDTNAFNSGLLTGRYGPYYTGNSSDYAYNLSSIAAENPAGNSGSTSYGATTDVTDGSSPFVAGTGLGGGYVSPDGSYVPPQAIPGITADPSQNPVVAGQPGELLDEPFQLGITTGLTQGITNWINGIGNWFKQAWDAGMTGVENWFIRAALIVAALVLVGVAVVGLIKPDSSDVVAMAKAA